MNWFQSFWKALTEPPAILRQSSAVPFDESMSNFTPRAQQVLVLARKEADRFNHNFLGTEHLLLGLIALGQGTAVNVLHNMGLNLETVRMEVKKQVGTGPNEKMISSIPYMPHVRKVLSLASKEAKALNHTYVGTEHILLGLLRESDGVAARVLKNLDVDITQCRQEILKELDPNFQISDKDIKTAGLQQNPNPLKPMLDSIDASKRYDVYCREGNQEMVVYRNAFFKGTKKVPGTISHTFASEFVELEQFSGQTVYLSLLSVHKFCEHDVEIVGEPIKPK
jgi:hypothetical protein